MHNSRKISFFHLFILVTSVFLVTVTNIPGAGILVSFASADTIPGGNVSGTWIQANSPYYITGNITIPNGQSLIIDPGVEVIFLGSYELTAIGLLNAVGTAADSILFTSSTGWCGIDFAATSAGQTNQLSYCSFSYAQLSQEIKPGSLVLSNCYFSNTSLALLWDVIFPGSTLQITDCVFRCNRMSYGAIWLLTSPDLVEITGCLFENNHSINDGGAIYISDGTNPVNITDCTFLGNTAGKEGGAIFARYLSATVTVENCVFGYNECFASGSWEGGGGICSWGTDFDLSYCLFYENEGLYAGAFNLNHLHGDASVTMDHCTVWGMAPSFQVFIGYSGNTLSVSNSIFSYCDCAIYMNSGTVPDVEYTDFYDNGGGNIQPSGAVPAGFGVLTGTNYNGDPCDCYYNIFLDPEFVNPSLDNYHLTVTSPCIDAGDPTFPYDPDGTITDMGMYYFNQTSIHGESPEELLPSECLLLCSPNPCYELLTVYFDIPGQSVEELAVYSIDGRQVVDMIDLCGSGTREAVLDVSCLNEGIYFCRLKAGSSSGTGRFVVIR